jgi:hypothetical protein
MTGYIYKGFVPLGLAVESADWSKASSSSLARILIREGSSRWLRRPIPSKAPNIASRMRVQSPFTLELKMLYCIIKHRSSALALVNVRINCNAARGWVFASVICCCFDVCVRRIVTSRATQTISQRHQETLYTAHNSGCV